MKKLKRIFALLGAILLAGMYLVTLILGLMANEASKDMLMASIACTVFVPCLIYGMMLIARVLDNRNRSEDTTVAKDPSKDR
jgi:membrane protein implicated in regulation of membrane protease activity